MSVRFVVGTGLAMVTALAVAGCCNLPSKKSDSDKTSSTADKSPLSDNAPVRRGTHFHFNRVPLEADIPPGWNESQNTRNWAVFKPTGGGGLMAFSPGSNCGDVEQRFYGAMQELGLTNVVWQPRRTLTINGLNTVTSEGTAIEASQLSYVKYAITRAPAGGCLATIFNIWQSRSGDYRVLGDRMFASIELQQ